MNTHDEAVAKIARPRNRHIYPRNSLFAKLDDAVDASGIWICGPPGSGKTTIISSYLKENNRTCLWYQIDDGDSDVASFFWYMRLAAAKVAPKSQAKLKPFTSAYQGSLKTFTARYFEELYASLPPNFSIVLDDYHLVNGDAAIDSVVLQAISTLPQHGNFVVVSREPPSPPFCRLIGNEKLRLVGWDDLRLTREEIRGICLLRQSKLSESCLERIAARIDGWAAGLIFHLHDNHSGDCDDIPVDANGHEALFGYFANEVLEKQDPESRKVLMQMALLPLMTQEMSTRLTGSERAAALLKLLHRRNSFVELQQLEVPTYKFHPLFRDFLLDRLKQSFSASELIDLEKKAAALLEVCGYRIAALKLYASAGEWDRVVKLILADARLKFRQGRMGSLEKSISELPGEVVDQYPWLSYWLGATRMFLDAQGAHRHFSAAFQQFQEANDAAGSLAAWSGAVNSLLAEWGDMKSLDKWIGPGEELLPPDSPLPQGYLGAQAVTAMCSALSICRPHHPDLEKYICKAHELIETGDDRIFSLMGCNLLLIFYAWQGNLIRMQALIEALRPGLERDDVSDAHRVMWAAAYGWFDLVSGKPEECLQLSFDALELSEKSGVHMFDYKFYGMATQANLLLGRATEAQMHIKGYLNVIPRKANLLHFHAHFLSAWQAWLAGNHDVSREQLTFAEQFLKVGGLVPIISAKTDIATAILHFEAGELAEGQARLGHAERIAIATGSAWLDYHCRLLQANFELNSGNRERCLQYLRSGLEIGRTHRLIVTDWWDAPLMSRLCGIALANGIEPQHARLIIETAALQPNSATVSTAAWPWPVMVEVLGQFRLKVQGSLVGGHGKSQKKVLELLKALIALGGERVSAARLADAIWPDAEGDEARNALKTTLHRLRKILGTSESVTFKDGFLSLCARHCWVDAIAFDALARTPRSDSERLANLKKALKLYRGPLLAAEEEQPWMIGPRARLQKKQHDIVMEIGVQCENLCKWNKAIRVYRKGLKMDPLDEQVWRHLMQSYHQSGRNEDALASYRQCRSELKEHLARNPAAKTERLAESITQSC